MQIPNCPKSPNYSITCCPVHWPHLNCFWQERISLAPSLRSREMITYQRFNLIGPPQRAHFDSQVTQRYRGASQIAGVVFRPAILLIESPLEPHGLLTMSNSC